MEAVLALLQYVSYFYWSVAIGAYVIRFLWPQSPVRELLRYGKLAQSAPHSSLLVVHPGPPKRIAWISFYSVAILQLVVQIGTWISWEIPRTVAQWLPMLMLLVQLLRRLVECVFVHNMSHVRVSWVHFLGKTGQALSALQ